MPIICFLHRFPIGSLLITIYSSIFQRWRKHAWKCYCLLSSVLIHLKTVKLDPLPVFPSCIDIVFFLYKSIQFFFQFHFFLVNQCEYMYFEYTGLTYWKLFSGVWQCGKTKLGRVSPSSQCYQLYVVRLHWTSGAMMIIVITFSVRLASNLRITSRRLNAYVHYQ